MSDPIERMSANGVVSLADVKLQQPTWDELNTLLGRQSSTSVPPELLRITAEYAVDTSLIRITEMQRYWYRLAVPLRDCITKCFACEQSMKDAEVVWSGAVLDLGYLLICDTCRAGQGPIPVSQIGCDASQFVGEFCDAPFDLRAGWHSILKTNEDLCPHHFAQLMASPEPQHAPFKERFRKISVDDLVPCSPLTQVMHCTDGPMFPVAEVELSIPPCLASRTVWSCSWFHSADSPWRHVNLIEGRSAYSGYLALCEPFENIQEWLPFDEANDGEWTALVNCNARSPRYRQVATARVLDSETRITYVDWAQLDIDEYIQYKSIARPMVDMMRTSQNWGDHVLDCYIAIRRHELGQ